MVFDRDNETWFAMIVNEPHQFQGIGKTLMSAMKKRTTQLNGWLVDHNNDIKSNGENYLSKKDYYLKHDFKILDHSRLETQQISAVQIQWEKA